MQHQRESLQKAVPEVRYTGFSLQGLWEWYFHDFFQAGDLSDGNNSGGSSDLLIYSSCPATYPYVFLPGKTIGTHWYFWNLLCFVQAPRVLRGAVSSVMPGSWQSGHSVTSRGSCSRKQIWTSTFNPAGAENPCNRSVLVLQLFPLTSPGCTVCNWAHLFVHDLCVTVITKSPLVSVLSLPLLCRNHFVQLH